MHNISFSGGLGSAVSALIAHKNDLPFRLIFADTLSEDADLYRFLHDVADRLDKPIIWLTDGRTPWDVFEDRKFIGNTRTAHCSTILKTDVVMRFLANFAAPDEPLVLGMDWSEQEGSMIHSLSLRSLSWLDTLPGGDWTWIEVGWIAAIVAFIPLMCWAELAIKTGGFGA